MMDEVLLINYLCKQSNEEECRLVEDWCAESSLNRKVLEELYYTLCVGDAVATMNAVDTESSLRKIKSIIQDKSEKKLTERSPNLWRRSMIIASFMVGIIIGGIACGILFYKNEAPYTITTEDGQRAQIELPDSTKVWLNASTKLTYQSSFWNRKRQVKLSGEAYFEVAHNKRSEFVVNSKGVLTNVLGTKFNIRARGKEDKVVATLFEGVVRINSKEIEGSTHVLKPGQTLSINTKLDQVELTEYRQPSDVLLWIKGYLNFKQTSLEDITKIIEKLHDVHFVFKDESIKDERFIGNFTTDNTPEEILNVLRHTKYFKYKVEDKNIYLFK